MTRITAEWLQHYLGAPRLELILRVTDRARQLGYGTFLAGGAVRDLLLDRTSSDLDLLVEGDASGLARWLAREHGGKVTVHSAFLTAAWQPPATRGIRDVLHLVTARSETYPAPGALPVVQPASVEKDLERRDFSINAMAVRLDDEHRYELLDPLGGEADLRHGVIRVLHEKSFIDDPTRMYRAVRYELRLGFVQDAATLGYIDRGRSYVEQVSGERIRHELDMILGEPDPGAMIARLDELDLLRSIHAALDWNQGAQSRIDRTKSPEPPDEPQASEVDIRWILWLMGVPAGTVPSLADRLAFTGRLQQALRVAIELRDHTSRLGAMKPSQIAAVLREKPELAIRALALAAPVAQVNNAFDSYLTAWREVKPVTTGEDLKALGLSPGPIYSQIIERLRAAWIDGEVATAEAERGLLATLLEQQSHTGALDAI